TAHLFFPYTTVFRSSGSEFERDGDPARYTAGKIDRLVARLDVSEREVEHEQEEKQRRDVLADFVGHDEKSPRQREQHGCQPSGRSEEHTSELQSRFD